MAWLKKTDCVFLLIVLLFSGACSNSEGKTREIFETARFEETQDNLKHAKQLYQEIITDHPGSSFAGKAKERLRVLGLEEETP